MRKLFLYLTTLFCIVSLCSCSDSREETEIQSKQDLLGKHIGVITGTFHDQLVLDSIGQVELSYFQSVTEIVLALQKEKIDAAIFELINATRFTKKYTDIKILEKILPTVPQAIGLKKGSPLKAELDPIIEKMFKDNFYEKLVNKWIENEDSELPEQDWEGKNGTLVVGTTGVMPPTNFVRNGKLVGSDAEFMYAIGKILDKKVEFVSMDFNALMPALETGKIDLCIASIVVTEERSKSIDFTHRYYESAIVALTRQNTQKSKKASTNGDYLTFADLEGKKVGVLSGTALDRMVQDTVKDVEIQYLSSFTDLCNALISGNIDAIAMDYTIAKLYFKHFPQLRVMEDYINDDTYGIAMPKGSPYKARVDSALQIMKTSGELQSIFDKWENETENATSDDLGTNDFEETINVSVDGTNPPFTFYRDGKLNGIDIDIIYSIAKFLHKKIVFSDISFASMIPSLGAKKTDLCISSISITEERAKLVDFSIPYLFNKNVIVVLNSKKEESLQQYNTLKDLEGKKIAVVTGTMYDKLVQDNIKNAKISYFMSYADLFNALNSRKVDAVGLDKAVSGFWTREFPKTKILDEKLSKDNYGIVISKGNPLKQTLDSLLQILKSNGKLDKIIDKWNNEKKGDASIPQVWEGKNGTFTVAVYGANPPFNFYKGEKLAGIDIDLALTLGKMMKKKVVFQTNEIAMIIPAVVSGKVDAAISGVSLTEERKESVDFSIPYYENEGTVIVRNESAFIEDKPSFFQELKKSFHRTFLQEKRWRMVLEGLEATLFISIVSGIFGTLLGFIVCSFRRCKNKISEVISAIFIRAIQGMPILVFLMILYYIVFGHSSLNGIVVAVIGFGINFGVYASEIMRSGMDAVEKGQLEAAAALGYNRRQSFFKILLPQAANHFIPVLKGEFISMVKMTSIVGYIAVMDLTKVTDIIRSRTMEAFFPLIATAILYFIIANILTYILTLVEKKTDPKHRERKVKGVN